MKQRLVTIVAGVFVASLLLGGVACAADISLPPVSVPEFTYYYTSSISAPTIAGPGKYILGYLEIASSGTSPIGVMNLPYPWIMRAYTDNPGFNYGLYPGGGSAGGFVSTDGDYEMGTKIWCANYGPAGVGLQGPPPSVDDETNWKGDADTDPVWLRLFDANDPGFVNWQAGGGYPGTNVPVDRMIVGVDPTYTEGLGAWVTAANPIGDATLPTEPPLGPFRIYIAVEASAITPASTYTCNLVVETAEI